MTGQPRLAVDAQLRLERGSSRFDLWTEGDRLVLNAPSIGSLSYLRPFESVLSRTTLDPIRGRVDPPPLEVRVRHATVATFGPDVEPTPAARLLGLSGALDPRGLVAAAVRSLG